MGVRARPIRFGAWLRSALAALMMLVAATSAAAEVGCTMNAMAAPTATADERADDTALTGTTASDEKGAPAESGTIDCASNCVLQWVAAPTSSAPHAEPALARQAYQPAAFPPLRAAGPLRTERPPQA